MQDIKRYRPISNSVGSGQVLREPYSFDRAKIIVREMTESLVLDLVDKALVTEAIVLHVNYDREAIGRDYTGATKIDQYGRRVPRPAHGTANLGTATSSTVRILEAMLSLYDKIVDKNLTIRKLTITAIRVVPEDSVVQQMDLFADPEQRYKERQLQKTMLSLQKRFGKNIVLKGYDLQEGATKVERNQQIGGHRA